MSRQGFKFNLYPLTVVGAFVFLTMGSFALTSLYEYLRLAASTEAIVDRWKVVKKSSSSYPICGWYHFEFQGHRYQGSSLLPPPYHLNRASAEQAIKKLNRTRIIWFDPHRPSISVLKKSFPIKKIIYSFIALGVTFYFGFVETISRRRNPIN